MDNTQKRGQWTEFYEEFQAESDRSCAILGAAFLDEHLKALLEQFFVEDPKIVRGLLKGPNAPLQTFAARTRVAYVLGFIAPSELQDLDVIREIRNDFAHDLHGVTFKTASVEANCAKLKSPDVILTTVPKLNSRDRFVISVAQQSHWFALRRLGIRDTRRKVRNEVEVVKLTTAEASQAE